MEGYHITRFKCTISTNNPKAYKESGKYGPLKEKKNEQELFLKNNLLVDLPDKDLKTSILKMLKELKEDVEKFRKFSNKIKISTVTET